LQQEREALHQHKRSLCHVWRKGSHGRDTDPTGFGGKQEERELAVRLHQTKEDIPKKGIIIDAT
jgi:hypothetical protein